jgi:hypothetical protein
MRAEWPRKRISSNLTLFKTKDIVLLSIDPFQALFILAFIPGLIDLISEFILGL